jgi:hypothetical protein
MKKSITLTLSDEELMELQRILLDEDREEALRFLKTHLEKQVRRAISGEGHCKPWFELPGGLGYIPDEFRK